MSYPDIKIFNAQFPYDLVGRSVKLKALFKNMNYASGQMGIDFVLWDETEPIVLGAYSKNFNVIGGEEFYSEHVLSVPVDYDKERFIANIMTFVVIDGEWVLTDQVITYINTDGSRGETDIKKYIEYGIIGVLLYMLLK